jgi:DMSO/TMAO reductase YedYZ molybdopterin-dependent catalytic subunit
MMTKRHMAGARRVLRGALAGLVAAGVALGVAELAAGLVGPLSSPVVAVGGAAIDMTPVPVKDFAITHFGSNDKTALLTGILVLLAVFAAVIGVLAVRWLVAGLAGLAVFGALGVSAAVTRPAAGAADALPSLIGVAAAAAALTVLIRSAQGTRQASRAVAPAEPAREVTPPARAGAAVKVPAEESRTEAAGPGRRRFLAVAGTVAAAAVVAGGAGDLLQRRFSAAAARARVRLPAAAVRAPAVPAGAELNIPGLSPFFTSPAAFYRVDTDLVVPQVPPELWTLRITGMVDRPIELTFAELLALPLIEHDMTLVCVSNEVGGPYAGNTRWLGASLPALLRRAGLRRGADQVLSTATDGMTISTPVETILDGRQALLAVAMNGQPLPLAQLKGGTVTVAGVAWAPHRGISAVEVNVDGGPWRPAKLAAADGTDTWRQWSWAWDAAPGLHTLQVRAADGTGAIQTSARAGVFPSGATGWDSTVVTVS